jgi:hypothetical protein
MIPEVSRSELLPADVRPCRQQKMYDQSKYNVVYHVSRNPGLLPMSICNRIRQYPWEMNSCNISNDICTDSAYLQGFRIPITWTANWTLAIGVPPILRKESDLTQSSEIYSKLVLPPELQCSCAAEALCFGCITESTSISIIHGPRCWLANRSNIMLWWFA